MGNSNKIHHKYWTDEEVSSFVNIDSFTELADLALRIMRRMPPGVHVVSGPVSTGGFGNVKDNMKVFDRVIEDLCKKQGLNVLSWSPFESVIRKLLDHWHNDNPEATYCMPILHEFYLPLFESGLITDVHFIDGWKSSFGSRWEHEQCTRLNIRKHYLPAAFSREMLSAQKTCG